LSATGKDLLKNLQYFERVRKTKLQDKLLAEMFASLMGV